MLAIERLSNSSFWRGTLFSWRWYFVTTESEYLTVKEAAKFLGVSPNTLRSWGAAKKIDEFRHPVNNYRLYKRSDLEELRLKIERPARSEQ
jgi:DNA (cytosine-5)-methyltransferase 1